MVDNRKYNLRTADEVKALSHLQYKYIGDFYLLTEAQEHDDFRSPRVAANDQSAYTKSKASNKIFIYVYIWENLGVCVLQGFYYSIIQNSS